ncbi:hypothetical protein PQO03_21690 [Lentisphaera profundi]|uniref:3-keto-disaccharide hydrolase domain-containing protein n=1 Tax=Lentisphaera profundi TaxID=1658616 RepID=A0ABY7VZX8_9BACT|nr:hypothetical protein [Lentisphaera profundi]WDE98427.1 hypothetical protein PQO03_21690 [Lentisphaera profundi]
MHKSRLSSLIGSTLLIFSSYFVLQAADKQLSSSATHLKPLLLKMGPSIISETFDKDSTRVQSWAKYGTQWQVIDGAFVGSPASLDYQKAHPGKHSGTTPRLQAKIPLCKDGLIIKFDFKSEKKIGRAAFWLGHHHFKLLISDNQPSLQYTKDKKNIITTALKPINGPMKENQWYSVIMETHGTHRVVQISGFEPLIVEAFALVKTSPVRMSGSKGEQFQFDNFHFIEGAGLLKP